MCCETEPGELAGRRLVAEVELAQPGLEVLTALGDLVELVLHRGGELVVHEVGEVVLEQVHDRERSKRRHQGLALLPHVAAPVDRLHDRGVGRGSTDAQVLELLDERRLGVAVRGLGVVGLGRQRSRRARAAPSLEGRQDPLLVGQLGFRIVGALDVGATKAGELDAQSRRS